MNNVREIAFEVTLEGNGIVQRDQGSQKFAYKNSEGSNIDRLDTENLIFAKANYYHNPKYNPDSNEKEKKYLRKIKISSAGLKHSIHRDVMPFHTPQFFQNPSIRKDILSSLDYILRGYMYAPSKGSEDAETIRRASVYLITDAEEIGGAVPRIEIGTAAGERNSNSLYYKESIGDTVYLAKGTIDMAQLQFISASANADRMALNDLDFLEVVPEMIRKYGENSVTKGYYHLAGAPRPLAEKGLILSDELIKTATSYLLERISNINIHSGSSFAKVQSLRIKFITDPTVDFASDAADWIEVFNPSQKVKNFNVDFTPHRYYVETSLEEIERHTKIAAEISATLAKNKKDEKK